MQTHVDCCWLLLRANALSSTALLTALRLLNVCCVERCKNCLSIAPLDRRRREVMTNSCPLMSAYTE